MQPSSLHPSRASRVPAPAHCGRRRENRGRSRMYTGKRRMTRSRSATDVATRETCETGRGKSMTRRRTIRLALVALILASLTLGATQVRPGSAGATALSTSAAGCQLGNGVSHVVNIVFDNVHFARDNPNVPSDLEQMPHLLNFLKNNGTVFSNVHTPLI